MFIREAGSSESDIGLVTRMRLEFMAAERGLDPLTLSADFVDRTADFVRRRTLDGSFRSWVAEDDTGCGGVVSMIVSERPPRPDDARLFEGYIVNMYVVSHHRRSGLGRRLFTACVDAAKENGIRKLTLYTTEAGRALYESLAFESSGTWLERVLPLP